MHIPPDSSAAGAVLCPRLFAAVPVPDEVKLSLYRWCSTSNLPFRRWTHRADYHITLQFYGSTRPDQAALLIRQLSACSAGWSPFTLQLDGPSVFGNPQSPKVLWAGITGDHDALIRLQLQVASASALAGFEPEARAFQPHLTLARAYNNAAGPFAEAMLESVSGRLPAEAAWRVEEIILYESLLGQQPMYRPYARFPIT